jgi:hypothetical protein
VLVQKPADLLGSRVASIRKEDGQLVVRLNLLIGFTTVTGSLGEVGARTGPDACY